MQKIDLQPLFSRRRLGVHVPPTDLRLARLGARLARLGVRLTALRTMSPAGLPNGLPFW